MNKPLKCVACWQEPKLVNLFNKRGQCYNCQEKYNRLLYLARCDACGARIYQRKMDKIIIHDVRPLSVPEIGNGLELNKLLKEFIQKKEGQQQIKDWFLFCFECENEIKQLPNFQELISNYGEESSKLFEKMEEAGIKLRI